MKKTFSVLITAILLAAPACGKKNHKDIFCMIGSEEFSPVADTWKNHFKEKDLHYEGRGNATGPLGLMEGICEMAAMTRPMTDSEYSSLIRESGKEPAVLPVALEAIAVISSKDNKSEYLTREEIIEIFSKGRFSSSEEITVFGINSASDRYRFFKENVLKGKSITDKIQEIPGPLQLVDNTSLAKNSFGYARPAETTAGVKILGVSENGRVSYPVASSIQNGEYPFARYYYIYVRTDKSVSEKTRNFLKFILSKDGQNALLPHGLYPVSEKERVQSLEKINSLPK